MSTKQDFAELEASQKRVQVGDVIAKGQLVAHRDAKRGTTHYLAFGDRASINRYTWTNKPERATLLSDMGEREIASVLATSPDNLSKDKRYFIVDVELVVKRRWDLNDILKTAYDIAVTSMQQAKKALDVQIVNMQRRYFSGDDAVIKQVDQEQKLYAVSYFDFSMRNMVLELVRGVDEIHAVLDHSLVSGHAAGYREGMTLEELKIRIFRSTEGDDVQVVEVKQ